MGSGVCKINARQSVACPKQVALSADTRLASSAATPPLPPQFQCCVWARGGFFVLQNKRPLLFSPAVIFARPWNLPAARAPLQINIGIGGRGGAAVFRKMPARVAGVSFANTGGEFPSSIVIFVLGHIPTPFCHRLPPQFGPLSSSKKLPASLLLLFAIRQHPTCRSSASPSRPGASSSRGRVALRARSARSWASPGATGSRRSPRPT